MNLNAYLKQLPLIAVLRGITPDEAVPVSNVLFHSGFRILEVTLNSPDAFNSIGQMAKSLSPQALIGAGTVTTEVQVEQVAACGGQLIVSPNTDIAVIKKTKELNLISIPGATTPTEAFQALQAGADAIKAFPAETITAEGIKALRAVLPNYTTLLPVGSIDHNNMQEFRRAGADGFGLGSALYQAGKKLADIQSSAELFVKTYQLLT